MSNSDELILAQEQSVIRKSDSRETQGTLVLTDKRLLFVASNKEESLEASFEGIPRRAGTLRFADVEDLKQIPESPNNQSIPLSSIERASGSEGIIHPPSLKIEWKVNGKIRQVEFAEEIVGGRKKDLKDWAKVIERLRTGQITIQRPKNPPPSLDTLEGKIQYVLGDMQEKGEFEIEEEVENTFKIDSDPDSVEEAADKLVSEGFADVIPDSSGDKFYRKRSPLGDDDLSS